MTSKRSYQGQFKTFQSKKSKRSIIAEIQQAYYNCDIEEVTNLLQKTLESEIEELDESGILFNAVQDGNDLIVDQLLKMGVQANIPYCKGESVLKRASENGDLNIVNMLLKHGARINYKDRSCQTALHKAIQNKHESVVDLLLSRGANVNIRSIESDQESFYSTPLELAVKNQ